MYFKDADHFSRGVKKAMEKGAKRGVAEVNKSTKLQAKNEQRKRDLAKNITRKKPEQGHEERHWKRMAAEGDRSENDYR